ncbi:MAG: trypsin-like serine protease [Acidimicrobiaceae bacterium]|nr:trypsin-like serine protease [Acidimicrobiaceae bacterium]
MWTLMVIVTHAKAKSNALATNPFVVVENLGPVVFDRHGDACSSNGCSKELGGISAFADGSRCSTGFTATHVYGGLGYSGYLLNGGHCAADNGDYVRHGGSSGPIMGTQSWEQDSGSVDASIINNVGGTMAQDKGNIWRSIDSSWPIYGTQSRTEAELGRVLCRTGYRSEACGQLISKSISRNGNTNVGRLEHTSACPGDSGGPVFDPETHYAVGLHQSSSDSSGCTSQEDSYFTFISELQAVVPTIRVDTGT